MSSACLDRIGAISAWIFCRTSLVLFSVRAPKTLPTLDSRAPPYSMASMVLANVAGSVEAAIVSISFFCRAMPSSKAGRKWASLIWSKGGVPKGAVHSARKGFCSCFTGAGVSFLAQAEARTARAAISSSVFFMMPVLLEISL